jgi:hypothetical protein
MATLILKFKTEISWEPVTHTRNPSCNPSRLIGKITVQGQPRQTISTNTWAL